MSKPKNLESRRYKQPYTDWCYIKMRNREHGLELEPDWNDYNNFVKDFGIYNHDFRLIRKDFKKGFLRHNCEIIAKSEYYRERSRRRSESGYIGVLNAKCWFRKRNKYYSLNKWKVVVGGRHIATYEDKVEAAKRYDFEVMKLGLNKPLNFEYKIRINSEVE